MSTASSTAKPSGTHSDANEQTSKGKVLVVLSGCHSIELKKKQDERVIEKETGFFLKELAQPMILLLEAGYELVFATPEGEVPHMDPLSDSPLWFLGNWFEKNREKALVRHLESDINSPYPLSAKPTPPLCSFSGILIPGGHGPMGDLGTDKYLGHILTHFHTAKKPTALICHGPIALLSTKLVLGGFAYKGYKATCYSNKEEVANELLWAAKLEKKVEDALREEGVEVVTATVPLAPMVVRDRELITGEGPSSAWQFGEEFVEALREYEAQRMADVKA
ncbi:ThiJ/PfpI family protein [Kalaharituber pfeilii]|nr:ThiJ/PfpI family protein [Kalaharituber pfeilii]